MTMLLRIFKSKSSTLYLLAGLLCLILLTFVVNYKYNKINISRIYEIDVSQDSIMDIAEEKSRVKVEDDISNICQTKLFHTEKLYNNKARYFPGYHRIVTDQCHKEDNPVKYILSLHSIWGTLDEQLEKTMFDDCPVKKCILTKNKNFKPIDQFDAIVFDLEYKVKIEKRSSGQQYVFFNLETPFITNYENYPTPGFFNLSLCYRRDCDIHYPYGIVKKKKTKYILPSVEKIEKKTKMIAWFVSNCGKKRREEYVAELKKYIPVDVYGKCGPLKCEKNRHDKNNDRDSPCYKMIENDYMFYLSFENAMCYDYATEKMYNILHYDTIPVVLGDAHYDSIIPENSVIKVSDFPTPKALAEYLIKVSQDPQLYLSYLEWKKDYVILGEPHRLRLAFCQLCDLLHRSFGRSSFTNIREWQLGKNCQL